MGPKQGLARLGLLAGIAGSVLVLGACTRPGGSSATATPSVVVRSATPSRTTTTVTRTTTAPAASAAPSLAPSAPPSAAPPSVAPTATAVPPTGQKYVVQPGDTLSSIAAQFGVPIQDLITANRLDNPDLLLVGQELIIPGR